MQGVLFGILPQAGRTGNACGPFIPCLKAGAFWPIFCKEREVGIGPTTSKALWKYIHKYRKPQHEQEGRVFLTNDGQAMHPRRVYDVFLQMRDKAGIQGVRLSLHTFRHTMARMWLENGGEVIKLPRVLGHASVTVTEVYVTLSLP